MKNFWIPCARNTPPIATRKIVKAQDWFETLLIVISSDRVFASGADGLTSPKYSVSRRATLDDAAAYTSATVQPAAECFTALRTLRAAAVYDDLHNLRQLRGKLLRLLSRRVQKLDQRSQPLLAKGP